MIIISQRSLNTYVMNHVFLIGKYEVQRARSISSCLPCGFSDMLEIVAVPDALNEYMI